MTPLTVTDLVTRAAGLSIFNLSEFSASTDDTTMVTFLQDDCERVETPSGETQWALADRPRRRCLATVPLAELRSGRAAAGPGPDTPLQRALDRSFSGGWTANDLAALTPEEARALSVVAGWWDGHNQAVPTAPEANQLVDKLNLFADLRTMAADHFTGRQDILTALRHNFELPAGPAFAVYGIGGIGKSALIAKHTVWALDEGGAAVAAMDFDDPTLNPAFPLDLVHRIIALIARQSDDGSRARLDRLVQVAADAAVNAQYRAQSSSRAAAGKSVVRDAAVMLADALDMIGRPLQVIFDTVEHVQRRGRSATSAFATLVETLVALRPVSVLVCGRAPVPELSAEVRQLTGLARPEALALLIELCARPLDEETAREVTRALGTSPLTIRLAARLLSDLDTVPGDLVALDLHAEQINGELYRRVLRHIRDDDVRRLAHPGLVLRRVTPEIILEVLAGPCEVPVADLGQARRLFGRLSAEAMLMDRAYDGEESLVHRADVRRVMLPQLLADRPEVAARIQRAAIDFYAARSDRTSRVEQLYHRLLVGEPPDTLATHWDAAVADTLAGVMDELPPASRLFLIRRLPEDYLAADDRRLISDADWVTDVRPQVERLLAVGQPVPALELIGERRNSHDRSLLPALEIEALEALGELARAVAIARQERRESALAIDPAGATTYTLHMARLLERGGDPVGAAAALQEALATMRMPGTDRLRLLVALLGLSRRRSVPPSDPNYRRYRTEAGVLHDRLGDDAILQVPGLLRDLAAEVGSERPAILDDALRTIGLDASADGPVPGALRDLDATVVAEIGRPGVVADLLRLKPDSPLDGIAAKPRGETGRALLEVLRAFGESADELRLAVRVDYQQEADAALFGLDINITRKA